MIQQRRISSILARIGIICAILSLSLGPIRGVAAVAPTTLYVAPAGRDSNNGTDTGTPLATLQHALELAGPGTVIYLLDGVYSISQRIAWTTDVWPVTASGAQNAMISVQPYLNAKPIFDCAPITTTDSCITIGVQYAEIKGLEIKNSPNSGIAVMGGSHIILRNNSIHHSTSQGIYVSSNYAGTLMPTDIVIDGNTIYQNVQDNNPVPPTRTGGWGTGIGISKRATSVRVINNRVFENHGEGIAISSQLDTTVRNNTIYDNYSVNLYLDGASDIVAEQNFIYTTRNAAFFRYNAPANGIAIADESDGTSAALKKILIQNNIVVGGRFPFYYGRYFKNTPLKDTTITHNTFYSDRLYPNSIANGGDSATIKIESNANPHTTTSFTNNAVMNTSPGAIRLIESNGITFNNNGWYNTVSTASGAGSGANDKTTNPQFVFPGGITPDSYKLLAASPLINAGAPSSAGTDFWGDLRSLGGAPDIGADEVVALSPATPRFEALGYRIDESGLSNESVAQVTLKVILPAAQPAPITLSYSTINGWAGAGADYQAVTHNIQFLAGQTSQIITIPLLEDGLAEEDEEFVVRLSNGASAIVVIATNDKVTFSTWGAFIKDAPPSSGQTPDQSSVISPSPMVLVIMKLNAPSRLPVSVNIATRNGTSLAGIDYQPLSATLTFEKPRSSYTTDTTSTWATVNIITDTINDDGEEFYIDALSATNAGIVQPSMVIITSNSGAQ